MSGSISSTMEIAQATSAARASNASWASTARAAVTAVRDLTAPDGATIEAPGRCRAGHVAVVERQGAIRTPSFHPGFRRRRPCKSSMRQPHGGPRRPRHHHDHRRDASGGEDRGRGAVHAPRRADHDRRPGAPADHGRCWPRAREDRRHRAARMMVYQQLLLLNTGDFALPADTRALGTRAAAVRAFCHRALALLATRWRAPPDFAQAAADDTLQPVYRSAGTSGRCSAPAGAAAGLVERPVATARRLAATGAGPCRWGPSRSMKEKPAGHHAAHAGRRARTPTHDQALFAIGQWHLVNSRTGMADESKRRAPKGIHNVHRAWRRFRLARIPSPEGRSAGQPSA